MSLLRLIKRRIISSSLFWSMRHIIQPSFIESYQNKDTSSLENEIMNFTDVNAVLDFGCATGSLLHNLKSRISHLTVIGIDINKRMLQICNNKFEKKYSSQDKYLFSQELNQIEITSFLKLNELPKIDICVFDRVLYCLDIEAIKEIFEISSKMSKHILIDDFFLDESDKDFLEKRFNGYMHRDWVNILSGHNFSPVKDKNTPYTKVEGASARRVIFSKV